MKIVTISDVHKQWHGLEIPPCDILISTGDYSSRGEMASVEGFHRWLSLQPARHVISVQGNHEVAVEKDFTLNKAVVNAIDPRIHFIDEGLIEIEGLKIWCSAITPYFHHWAWNRHRGRKIRKHWKHIPDDVDVLAVHGPPYKILDEVREENVGCQDLLKRIQDLKLLKLVTFGHIHEGYGRHDENGVIYLNSSICNGHYYPENKPHIVEL